MRQKNVFWGTLILMVACASFYVQFKQSNSKENGELLMQNVEALAEGEETSSDCGGFRVWSTSGFLRAEKQFYDCKCILRTGYNPKGNCN